MYLGVFTKCRGLRNTLFIGIHGEGIIPVQQKRMNLKNRTIAESKEVLKTKQNKKKGCRKYKRTKLKEPPINKFYCLLQFEQ